MNLRNQIIPDLDEVQFLEEEDALLKDKKIQLIEQGENFSFPLPSSGDLNKTYCPDTFIDGTMRLLHLGAIKNSKEKFFPVLCGQIGAIRITLKDRKLSRKDYIIKKIVGMMSDNHPIRQDHDNIDFFNFISNEVEDDYDLNKRNLYEKLLKKMKELEVEVLKNHSGMVIVDGLLDKIMIDSDDKIIPIGVVKSIREQYFPPEEHYLLFHLREGSRTRAFQFNRDGLNLVSWYVRLWKSPVFGYNGLIRVELSKNIFDREGIEFINCLSGYLYILRYPLKDYERYPSSLWPIIEAERMLNSLFETPLGLKYYYLNKLKEVGIELIR